MLKRANKHTDKVYQQALADGLKDFDATKKPTDEERQFVKQYKRKRYQSTYRPFG